MGWFGFLLTNLVVTAIACAIAYLIFHLIYNISFSNKACAIIAFILNAIALITLFGDKPGFANGQYAIGTVGTIVVVSIAFSFGLSALMVGANGGEDMGEGMAITIPATLFVVTVAAILQIFAKTYWPMYVLSIGALLLCTLSWFQDN